MLANHAVFSLSLWERAGVRVSSRCSCGKPGWQTQWFSAWLGGLCLREKPVKISARRVASDLPRWYYDRLAQFKEIATTTRKRVNEFASVPRPLGLSNP